MPERGRETTEACPSFLLKVSSAHRGRPGHWLGSRVSWSTLYGQTVSGKECDHTGWRPSGKQESRILSQALLLRDFERHVESLFEWGLAESADL